MSGGTQVSADDAHRQLFTTSTTGTSSCTRQATSPWRRAP
jgi:hypothetical protein